MRGREMEREWNDVERERDRGEPPKDGVAGEWGSGLVGAGGEMNWGGCHSCWSLPEVTNRSSKGHVLVAASYSAPLKLPALPWAPKRQLVQWHPGPTRWPRASLALQHRLPLLVTREPFPNFLSCLEKLGQNCDERNPKQNKGHTHAHTSLWKQLLCVKMITASERLSLASIASSLVSLSNQWLFLKASR